MAPDWPLPKVFYFRSSLEERPEQRETLHAKCVVVDGLKVFISCANFSETAQRRNLEVGLLIVYSAQNRLRTRSQDSRRHGRIWGTSDCILRAQKSFGLVTPDR